jgi:hypothetical protein
MGGFRFNNASINSGHDSSDNIANTHVNIANSVTPALQQSAGMPT